MENQTNINFPIFEEDGVHGYVDENGIIHLLIDDVARGLGFVEVKKGRVTTSGDKFSASGDTVSTSGDKYYKAIRWARINKYLRDIDCLGKDDPDVKSGSYIPEQWFYFLAMKANNEAAKKFQKKVAFKILPSLRKNGYYYLNKPIAPVVTKPKKNPRRVAGQKAHASVYIFRLPDGNVCIVKIGQSKDVETRKKQIEKLYNVTITTYYKTCELPSKVARAFEQACHKIFAPFKVKGELFAVEYETALRIVAAVEDMLRALPILFDEERAEIILSIADTLGVVPERKALLVEAANIIAGKELVGVVGDIFLPASK